VPVGAAALEMVSEQGISFLSVVEKKDNSSCFLGEGMCSRLIKRIGRCEEEVGR
jgi:hypothetical protein